MTLAALTIVGTAALILCIAWPFCWFWNGVVPAVFSLPKIGYVEACGLLALVSLVHVAWNGLILSLKLNSERIG